MKDDFSTAGKSTREMAKKRHRAAIWLAILTVTLILIIGYIILNNQAFGIGGITILALLVIMRILPDIMEGNIKRARKAERRAIRGAKAEETIGEILQELGDDYFVIHDVDSPYGNIDHIVLGRFTGVFLIETKAHGGKVEFTGKGILVNGKMPEKDFIAQCLKNTYWLKERICSVSGVDVWITPILVFSNAYVPFGKPIKGVRVTNRKFLLEQMRKGTPAKGVSAVWEARERIASSTTR